ncbi:hypothetical protein FB446DRAFT_782499 [Lentinula raphanica]|uniref:Uncharacterized protein n=1 Tax=Lentinula raphanica TaxID=153919 RepID=A0AA38PLB1_9AGAR|nr:hypothetical protein FB446DRAFT_782499 [Lentinula raphanica]KAJ3845049.1 hypothetical protein F5878DRAFT_600378 [Lentinula raphanica]
MDEPTSSRRKSSNKRRANVLLSESEDDQNLVLSSPAQKRFRYTKQAEWDEDALVNVDDNDVPNESPSSLSRSTTPPPKQKLHLKRGRDSGSMKYHGNKKSRSGDDTDDEYEVDILSDDLGPGPADEYDDADLDFADDSPKKGKGRPTPKNKGGKNGKGMKNSRAKNKAESQQKEIIVRDERQGVASSSMKIRIKPSLTANPAPATKSSLDPAVPILEIDDRPTSQAQAKRKLPPIKKNKTTSSAATNVKPKTTTTDDISATLASSAAKPSTGSQGGDFNLQDRSVYEMLFKNAGGSNARAGSIRDKERRRDLDNLREADKARRAIEAKRTFDLQAQMDKISAFEDRLRRANSCVLYPNILGAKMRETFEQNRRRREPQEEGEMTWSVYR